MRKFIILVLVLSSLVVPSIYAQDDACTGIAVLGGWARVPDADAHTGAYGYVANLGAEDDVLLSATSSMAESVALVSGDMMAETEDGFVIPAGGFLNMEPGAPHLSIDGVNTDLAEGDVMTINLAFQNAGNIQIEVLVQEFMLDMDMSDDDSMDMSEDEDMDMDMDMDMGMMMSGINTFATVGCSDVQLVGAWVRPSFTDVGAAYGLLINFNETEDALVSATSNVSEVTELHEMVMEDGVMSMSPIEGGFVVPANGFTVLEQGGLHFMLIGLTQELAEGDTVELSGTFESGQEFSLVAPVEDRSAMDME